MRKSWSIALVIGVASIGVRQLASAPDGATNIFDWTFNDDVRYLVEPEVFSKSAAVLDRRRFRAFGTLAKALDALKTSCAPPPTTTIPERLFPAGGYNVSIQARPEIVARFEEIFALMNRYREGKAALPRHAFRAGDLPCDFVASLSPVDGVAIVPDPEIARRVAKLLEESENFAALPADPLALGPIAPHDIDATTPHVDVVALDIVPVHGAIEGLRVPRIRDRRPGIEMHFGWMPLSPREVLIDARIVHREVREREPIVSDGAPVTHCESLETRANGVARLPFGGMIVFVLGDNGSRARVLSIRTLAP